VAGNVHDTIIVWPAMRRQDSREGARLAAWFVLTVLGCPTAFHLYVVESPSALRIFADNASWGLTSSSMDDATDSILALASNGWPVSPSDEL
jgi:hypothetical protein